MPIPKSYPDPQYLIVNKIPSGGTRGTKYFWDPKKIESIRAEAIDEIRKVIATDGSPTRRLGFCFIIPYLEKNVDSEAVLQRMLKISAQKKMPVLVKLDGISWWETRSDLWNFWNPNLEGYNPDNKYNVEWTSWNPKDAIKISWRSWEKNQQMRVKPHPNLGSPRYIEEKQTWLNKLIPLIVDWYHSLPRSKKYLLAGVVLDNELSIGLNHYYYPNGNTYLDKDPEDDPKQRFNFKKGASAGFIQLGYAAVKSYSIKEFGRITINDLNKAVTEHGKFLGKTAIECGLDFDKIFIHGMGNFKNNPARTFDYSNVITPFGHPGWSLYDIADDPSKSSKLAEAIDQLNGKFWGAVEWFLFKRKKGVSVIEYWRDALRKVLNYRHNKILAIYNWEAISTRPMVIKAIREVMQEIPTAG